MADKVDGGAPGGNSRVYEAQTAFSQADQKEEKVTFTMVAQNVPVGARVSFEADKPTKSGLIINMPWVTVTPWPAGGNVSPDFEIGTTVLVEPGYSTIITYRTDFNGTTPPEGFSMSMTASVMVAGPPGSGIGGEVVKVVASHTAKPGTF
jgi:hypothetical protein